MRTRGQKRHCMQGKNLLTYASAFGTRNTKRAQEPLWRWRILLATMKGTIAGSSPRGDVTIYGLHMRPICGGLCKRHAAEQEDLQAGHDGRPEQEVESGGV
jgi:hypothetical protein